MGIFGGLLRHRILRTFLLFLAGVSVLTVMVYLDVAVWLLTWTLAITGIFHFGHEGLVGLGAHLQKRYRDDLEFAASGWQRSAGSLVLIACAILCGVFPALLPALFGFALIDFPLTHSWLFRYRDKAKYNYRPIHSSPGHDSGAVLWVAGALGTLLMMGTADVYDWGWTLWWVGLAIGPVIHAVGFLAARRSSDKA